jgi:hypothetical protein
MFESCSREVTAPRSRGTLDLGTPEAAAEEPKKTRGGRGGVLNRKLEEAGLTWQDYCLGQGGCGMKGASSSGGKEGGWGWSDWGYKDKWL